MTSPAPTLQSGKYSLATEDTVTVWPGPTWETRTNPTDGSQYQVLVDWNLPDGFKVMRTDANQDYVVEVGDGDNVVRDDSGNAVVLNAGDAIVENAAGRRVVTPDQFADYLANHSVTQEPPTPEPTPTPEPPTPTPEPPAPEPTPTPEPPAPEPPTPASDGS